MKAMKRKYEDGGGRKKEKGGMEKEGKRID